MGRQNKQRRAAKARKRTGRYGGPSGFRTTPWESVEAIKLTLESAAVATAHGAVDAAADCAEQLRGPASPIRPQIVDRAAAAALGELLGALWGAGWQPNDIVQASRRQLGAAHVLLAAGLILDEARQYAAARVDPRWRAQLEGLDAPPPDPDAASPLAAWARARGLAPVPALAQAIELLGLLIQLPPLPVLLPPPGTASCHPTTTSARPVDDRALARIRALLAKAESSEFPEEAEALSAKAQELMTRYAIDRLVVEATDAPTPAAGVRIYLDAPYAGAKALLVQAVARANRCRSVWSAGLDFVTVIGDERDCAGVELLSTSLLLQATRAMLTAPTREVHQQRRTRSFRQSFLVAYGDRIGERLRGATASAVAEATDAGRGDHLLPVLAAAEDRAARACAELFPGLVERSLAANNRLGWAAGRGAADMALLDIRMAITPEGRAAS